MNNVSARSDMTEAVADFKPATAAAERRAKLFRGFADPSRLAILDALRVGPLVVHEIVECTGLTQPNVSNHLRCLSECGLVTGLRDGRFVCYRIGSPRVADLLCNADALLDAVAEGVDSCPNYRLEEDAVPPGGA